LPVPSRTKPAALMAAADPILPAEEVALLELEKVAQATPLDKVPLAPAEHPRDPDATLPWDRCQPSAWGQPEPAETKRRSSPEGGREDPKEAAPTCPPAEAEDEEALGLPVMPAHVFVPIDPQCIERTPGKPKKKQPTPWAPEKGKEGNVSPSDRPDSLRQKQVFLPIGPSRYSDPLGFEGRTAKPLTEGPRCPCARDCGTGNLKAVASVVGALLLCPCFVYGAYVFLPFDAPLLPTVSARLVYTLRCAAFATFPIVLGELGWGGWRAKPFTPTAGLRWLWGAGSRAGAGLYAALLLPSEAADRGFPPRCISLVLPQRGFAGRLLSPSLCPSGMIVSGISRLCSSALEPFGELQREVEIHRTYVSQSVQLFILYFFNMAVLATYLPQEVLKLIPLLTGLFAISR